jgi:hypothetical protein
MRIHSGGAAPNCAQRLVQLATAADAHQVRANSVRHKSCSEVKKFNLMATRSLEKRKAILVLGWKRKIRPTLEKIRIYALSGNNRAEHYWVRAPEGQGVIATRGRRFVLLNVTRKG